MIRSLHSYLLLLLLVLSAACSSSRWNVENQKETDYSDFELLSSVEFLERTGNISPSSPIISYNLKSSNTFRYTQRVRTDRYIQRYRPSLKSVLFGALGAGVATSAALLTDQSTLNKNLLYGTAGFITLTSFLNMKPVGEPKPTGEVKLLRKTGTVEETDTVAINSTKLTPPSYAIYYRREAVVLQNEMPFVNGRYSINLIDELNPDDFRYDSTEYIEVEVYFNNDTYYENIPLKSIFESFAVVSSQVTALRDKPSLDTRNVLTDLAFGSQLKLVSETDSWYKVLYGISETWISKNDAYPIWRPYEFASELSIITVPNIPFGNVDVESNIPQTPEINDSTFAFILANRAYQGEYSERSYAERDGRLMEEYLQKAIGVPQNNIFKATNIESQVQLRAAYNRMANNLRNDQKRLIVYISGYIKAGKDNTTLLISANEGDENTIDLNEFFKGISNLPVEQIIVFADLDNVEAIASSRLTETLGNQVLAEHPNSLVVFGSTEGQRSRDFSNPNGEQKRHSIFTYFIADAIKKGNITGSEIINHLQRNVDYTSRRLHNQPQHVVYYGDTGLSLID